jgi:hypothetical protein
LGAWTRARAALASAFAVACVSAAVCAGGARAGTLAVSLTQCGNSNNGFQFAINGAGFAGMPLEVDVTSSEPGAVPNPNYLFPAGVTAPFVNPVAVVDPDGTFSFAFASGTAQLLPATITVYSFDPVDEVTTGVLLTVTAAASTICADGTSLAASSGGSSGGGGGLPTTVEQCKKNGWTAYQVFKSQGDCVSFIATGGKNPPAH